MGRKQFNYALLLNYIPAEKIRTKKEDIYKRDMDIDFDCVSCGIPTKKGFRYIVEKGGPYCEPCTYVSASKKHEETCMQKYNVPSHMLLPEVLDKIKQTNIKKYGVEHNLLSSIVQEKIKATNLAKFGVEHPAQNPEIAKKISDSHKSEEVKNKKKETNLERYGVEFPFQSEQFKEKRRETNLERYGYEHASQSAEVIEKMKKTNIEKYGYEFISQAPEIKEKVRSTNMERYGVPQSMMNPEIAARSQAASFHMKEYTFPSGNIVKIQGYENYAIDLLLDIGYSEEDIVLKNADKPEIWYHDLNSTKQRRHFVDIYIPKDNWCIEVKSTWTYKCHTEEVHAKKAAAEALGYVYQVWIIDNAEVIEIV